MTVQDQQSITIAARADDAYDAIVRILVDAQRLGLALLKVTLSIVGGCDASIRITVLAGEAAADCDAIRARFARHPALNDVAAFENGGALCRAPSDAVLSLAPMAHVHVVE